MIDSLKTILNDMNIENQDRLNVALLKKVEIHLEKSSQEDIVFYCIRKGLESSEMLSNRLKQGNPGIIIFNVPPGIVIDRAYAVVPEKHFFNLQKKFCNIVYPINFEKKRIIGVTGTNGKTSVCHFLSEMLSHLGHSILSVGTLGEILRTPSGHRILGESSLTTPAYVYLRKLFFLYRDTFDFVVMELSSHALAQGRLGDVRLDLGIWTNFTRDHLDYHESMEEYFLAKVKVFHHLKPSGHIMIHKEEREILNGLDDFDRSRVVLYDKPDMRTFQSGASPLFKGFMSKNVAAAVGAVEKLLSRRMDCLDFLTPPPGRFNVLQKEQKIVVVDYAHTPDALKNLICLAKEHFVGKRINVLFGCGGERDVGKRESMGRVAQEYADKVYLTSDNPRGEEPHAILEQIKSSMTRVRAVNPDRKDMIGIAIDDMEADEVLLVAGKGHERYQEIKGIKYPFDDLETVRNCL